MAELVDAIELEMWAVMLEYYFARQIISENNFKTITGSNPVINAESLVLKLSLRTLCGVLF